MRKLCVWKEELPRQFTSGLTDPSQARWSKTDLFGCIDGRFVMVDPDQLRYLAQSNHQIDSQGKVDHVDGLPALNGLERKAVSVGNRHGLAVGEGISDNGCGTLPVKIRLMVKALHRNPVMLPGEKAILATVPSG